MEKLAALYSYKSFSGMTETLGKANSNWYDALKEVAETIRISSDEILFVDVNRIENISWAVKEWWSRIFNKDNYYNHIKPDLTTELSVITELSMAGRRFYVAISELTENYNGPIVFFGNSTLFWNYFNISCYPNIIDFIDYKKLKKSNVCIEDVRESWSKQEFIQCIQKAVCMELKNKFNKNELNKWSKLQLNAFLNFYFDRGKSVNKFDFIPESLFAPLIVDNVLVRNQLSLPNMNVDLGQIPSDIMGIEEDLKNIIGMEALKKEVRSFAKTIVFYKDATNSGIKLEHGNLNMVFTGNPGTGKTMLAGVIGKILKRAAIMSSEDVCYVNGSDFINNISEYFAEAENKILFIDEAYQIIEESNDDLKMQNVSMLMREMDACKNKTIVILAGYAKEINRLLRTNPGLKSRFGYRFHFDDYTADELTAMFVKKVKNANMTVSGAALSKVKTLCKQFSNIPAFGNGRFVERLFEKVISKHAVNYIDLKSEIKDIEVDDIPDAQTFDTQVSKSQNNVPKLEDVVGLDDLKKYIQGYVDIKKFEISSGMNLSKGNNHLVFLGNPGTGKTTVARIIANELYECGLLTSNKCIEVSRGDIIAKWVGWTAKNVQEIVERALGGVLFIDEAYSLVELDRDSFGKEAVDTLIKCMEDYRENLVVILAGYKDEMGEFLKSNPGLKSRIGETFVFPDYNEKELITICLQKLRNDKFSIDGDVIGKENVNNVNVNEELYAKLAEIMKYCKSIPNIGNGRFAERVCKLIEKKHISNCKDKDAGNLKVITKADIVTVDEVVKGILDGENLVTPDLVSDEDRKRTMYHELGHALVAIKKIPQCTLPMINFEVEGNGSLGYVKISPPILLNKTKADFENSICISMAGMATEQVIYGAYDSGCTSDLQSATENARFMITKAGMSRHGFAVDNSKEISSTVREEINEILKECFDEATNIITENVDKLKNLVEFLSCQQSKVIDEKTFRSYFKESENASV